MNTQSPKSLSINRETVRELNSADLGGIVGAQRPTSIPSVELRCDTILPLTCQETPLTGPVCFTLGSICN